MVANLIHIHTGLDYVCWLCIFLHILKNVSLPKPLYKNFPAISSPCSHLPTFNLKHSIRQRVNSLSRQNQSDSTSMERETGTQSLGWWLRGEETESCRLGEGASCWKLPASTWKEPAGRGKVDRCGYYPEVHSSSDFPLPMRHCCLSSGCFCGILSHPHNKLKSASLRGFLFLQTKAPSLKHLWPHWYFVLTHPVPGL